MMRFGEKGKVDPARYADQERTEYGESSVIKTA
jgi:hypothetical protein